MKRSSLVLAAAATGAVAVLSCGGALRAVAQASPPAVAKTGYPAEREGGAAGGQGGGVALAQFQARTRRRLMRADTDHDGRISPSEWTAWRAAYPGPGGGKDPSRSFARMDANHDGYITPEEIDAFAARRFARMDANHDGVLTPDERRPAPGGER